MFEIAETAEFRKRLGDLSLPEQRRVTQKLTDYIYPILRGNPFSGPNIKRLSNYSPATWRYRLGQYRVFYQIHPRMVFVVSIQKRKDAYR